MTSPKGAKASLVSGRGMSSMPPSYANSVPVVARMVVVVRARARTVVRTGRRRHQQRHTDDHLEGTHTRLHSLFVEWGYERDDGGSGAAPKMQQAGEEKETGAVEAPVIVSIRCADDQPSLPIATAVSDMRLEKPHSLSYQLMTRTSVPSMTLVWSMWKVDEWLSWLKSIDTFGASVQPRMTLSWLAAASLIALLISSLSVFFLATNLKSISETFGVGTRIAVPSSLPLSSGSTRPTAFAAPVEVGIIDIAAARPR